LAWGIAVVLVVCSGWFRERVRERIIAEIEHETGGRVELGSFSFNWTGLEATVTPLVLHGKESAGEPPLLRIPSVSLGLRIISAVERRVDLASLRIEKPAVHLIVYPDGSTNLPGPRHRTPSVEDLFRLAVRRYDVVDGEMDYDNRKFPLNVRGENLRLRVAYEPSGPQYRGELSSRRIRVAAAGIGPVEIDASTAFTLRQSRIEVSAMRLATGGSRVELAGALDDLKAPHGTFTVKANVPLREAVTLFHLPIDSTGQAAFDGRMSVSFASGFDFTLRGRASARGLGYSSGRLKIDGGEMRADVSLVPAKLTLRAMTATALGATLTGQADLADWKTLHFEGKFDGLNVREAAKIATDRPIVWNGTLGGDLTLDAVLGERAAKLQTNASITPAADGTPIQGQLGVSYDQAAGKVRLAQSYLATPTTRVDLEGTLGETLAVRARSTNLEDLLPALAMASNEAPVELPVKLNNGRTRAPADRSRSPTPASTGTPSTGSAATWKSAGAVSDFSAPSWRAASRTFKDRPGSRRVTGSLKGAR
jgi:translocation and assembly module TamB